MTSRPVEMSNLFANATSAKSGSVQETAKTSTSFTNVLKDASGNQKNDVTDDKKIIAKTSVQKDDKEAKRPEIRDTKNVDKKAPQETETTDKEAVQKAAKEITDKVKEELGVTEEQIREAMETLGFQMTDLLQGEKVTALVAELTGTEDPMLFVTDPTLGNSLKEILGTVDTIGEQLLQDLGLTQEEFQKGLEGALLTTPQENDAAISAKDITDGEENVLGEQEKGLTEEASTDQTPKVVVIKEDEKAAQGENRTSDIQSEGKETTDASTVKEVKASGQETAKDNSGEMMGNGQNGFGENFFKNVMAKAEQTTSFTNTQPEKILQQITEQIKLILKPESTSLEMQLNPASLGKVGLQIEQKGGSITAHFTAQNESVRSAIESQVVTLRENLENQGIKVDSVEVTIASHEFERNLQQDTNGNNENQEESGRRVRRRINLNAGDDSAELLTEEEELAKNIMIDNGNSVDYSA